MKIKITVEVRDSNRRTLVRDMILGAVAVISVSLAVPAWILRAEYRKTYGAPVRLVPTAEVLRETTAGTVIAAPRARDILELAERLVQQEAEKREVEKREAEKRATARSAITRSTLVPVRPAAAHPAPTIPPAVYTPRVEQSLEAP